MIKGINRQVIEVDDTGSTYYERAWLIVKPQYSHIHSTLLQREAKKLVKDMDGPSYMRFKRNPMFWIMRLGFAAALGSGLTILIQTVFM